MERERTAYQIVCAIVGPIRAVSESEDRKRLENLKELTHLVDLLLDDIEEARKDCDRDKPSARAIGRHARRFLDNLADAL